MNAAFGAIGQLSTSGGTISRLAAEFHVEWPLLAAQILNFTVVALVLYRFAIGPLIRIIEERRIAIENGLSDSKKAAEKLAVSGEQCEMLELEAHGKAEKIVGNAKLAADALAFEQKKQTTMELAALHEKESKRIASECDAKLRDARKMLRGNAADLAAKILKEGVDESVAEQFLSAAVAKTIGSVANG
jgi:F-type H+-transporting ATPase subunit b